MKYTILIQILLLLVAQVAFGSRNKEIHVALPSGLAAPLFLEKNQIISGLIVDYVTALAESMGKTVAFSVVTRDRLDSYL